MFHESCENASTLAPPAQLLMAHCQKWSRADHSALTMNFNWRHSSRVIKILRLEAGRCTVSSLCVWPWPLGLIVARQDLVQSTEAILKIHFKGSISLAAKTDLNCWNLRTRIQEIGESERNWEEIGRARDGERRRVKESDFLLCSLLFLLFWVSFSSFSVSFSSFWVDLRCEGITF